MSSVQICPIVWEYGDLPEAFVLCGKQKRYFFTFESAQARQLERFLPRKTFHSGIFLPTAGLDIGMNTSFPDNTLTQLQSGELIFSISDKIERVINLFDSFSFWVSHPAGHQLSFQKCSRSDFPSENEKFFHVACGYDKFTEASKEDCEEEKAEPIALNQSDRAELVALIRNDVIEDMRKHLFETLRAELLNSVREDVHKVLNLALEKAESRLQNKFVTSSLTPPAKTAAVCEITNAEVGSYAEDSDSECDDFIKIDSPSKTEAREIEELLSSSEVHLNELLSCDFISGENAEASSVPFAVDEQKTPKSYVQTGVANEVQTGVANEVQTGVANEVQTGAVNEVQTGAVNEVQTGVADGVVQSDQGARLLLWNGEKLRAWIRDATSPHMMGPPCSEEYYEPGTFADTALVIMLFEKVPDMALFIVPGKYITNEVLPFIPHRWFDSLRRQKPVLFDVSTDNFILCEDGVGNLSTEQIHEVAVMSIILSYIRDSHRDMIRICTRMPEVYAKALLDERLCSSTRFGMKEYICHILTGAPTLIAYMGDLIKSKKLKISFY
jgi:hypothetical protein